MPAGLTALFIGLVTLAGLVVRAVPLALSDFPVNDGGLFVAMTLAIQDAGWALPATLDWNGSELPLIYPPLAFYLAGSLHLLFGQDLLDIFRWFPLLSSVLVIPSVYLLARTLLRSDLGGVVAALAYAVAPASYVWLIQGGGVPRSPGMVVAVLAIWQVVLLVRAPTRKRAVGVGLLAGLTALIHPGAAVFVAVSAVLIWLFEGRTSASAADGAVAAGVALLVTAPWLWIVIPRHGLDALLAVPSNGPPLGPALLSILAGRYTGLPFLDPLAVIGLASAIVSLVRRRLLLPTWFLVGTLLSFQYGMVPWSVLIGWVAVELAARHGAVATRQESTGDSSLIRRAPLIGAGLLGFSFLVTGLASSLTVLNPPAPVHALTSQRRDAMGWVSQNLELGARLAVITDSVWSTDPDSEWFTLLANRESVATVQGTELLGSEAFSARLRGYQALQACVAPASVECVEDWLADWAADYLYLSKGRLDGPTSPDDCCTDLRDALRADDHFTAIYDEAGATVFEVGDAVQFATAPRPD